MLNTGTDHRRTSALSILKKLSALTVLSIIVGGIGNCAWAAQAFPPPDFEGGHELPTTLTPQPPGGAFQYLDVAVLTAALTLAAYLVLKKRSRNWIIGLMVFSLAYFGFYREGCICSIGAVQNVTLALFDGSYAVPITVVAFFALPLLFALFFGRVFCSSVCPLGAVQDLFAFKPISLPGWLNNALRLLAYVYLGLAVLMAATGTTFIICRYDPFVSIFRLSGNTVPIILGICFIAIGIFVARPYCRFICPYGVLLGLCSRVSQWRVRITPDECIQCRLCEDACPFGAIQHPSENEPPHEQEAARRRLPWMLAALPVLIIVGALIGGIVGPTLARTHYTVQLSERIYLEDNGKVTGDTDASRAFRSSGRLTRELHSEALDIRREFRTGGRFLGAFIGLVIGMKLLLTSIKRTRTDYEADRGMCLACGRCFEYCPIERRRLKELEGIVHKE